MATAADSPSSSPSLATRRPQAISGISLPVGSVKLYSCSADSSVRVWDCNSGKEFCLLISPKVSSRFAGPSTMPSEFSS
ncbi:hypothetical protein E2562_000785, partial [Oryza meyeriana var. granulata]